MTRSSALAGAPFEPGGIRISWISRVSLALTGDFANVVLGRHRHTDGTAILPIGIQDGTNVPQVRWPGNRHQAFHRGGTRRRGQVEASTARTWFRGGRGIRERQLRRTPWLRLVRRRQRALRLAHGGKRARTDADPGGGGAKTKRLVAR